MKPSISVIIAVYNSEKYLKECIKSVINQTKKDIEIICVNDGSTDNSLSILNDFAKRDNRIKIINQINQRQGIARNNGFKIANGEYVLFVDNDDILNKEMLEKLYNKAKESNAEITVCNSYRFFDVLENNKKHYAINYEIIGDKKEFTPLEFKENVMQIFMPWAWDKLIKKEYLEYLDVKFSNKYILEEHPIIYPAILKANKIAIVDDYLYNYRENKTGVTQSKLNANLEILETFKEVEKYITPDLNETFYKYMLFFTHRYIEKPFSYKTMCKQYKYIKNTILKTYNFNFLKNKQLSNLQKKRLKTLKRVKRYPNYLIYSLFS